MESVETYLVVGPPKKITVGYVTKSSGQIHVDDSTREGGVLMYQAGTPDVSDNVRIFFHLRGPEVSESEVRYLLGLIPEIEKGQREWRKIAEFPQHLDDERAFMAGVLHDIPGEFTRTARELATPLAQTIVLAAMALKSEGGYTSRPTSWSYVYKRCS
jgi:hypothetical protein